jgi:hypothetical protein
MKKKKKKEKAPRIDQVMGGIGCKDGILLLPVLVGKFF